MKNDTFTVIPQNMREYQMSVRKADIENDLYRVAFDQAIADDPVPKSSEDYLLAEDFFKAGWEAAVRLLNDDEPETVDCEFREGDIVRVTKEKEFCWWILGDERVVTKVRDQYQDVIVDNGNCIDWDCLEIVKK